MESQLEVTNKENTFGSLDYSLGLSLDLRPLTLSDSLILLPLNPKPLNPKP